MEGGGSGVSEWVGVTSFFLKQQSYTKDIG